MKKKAYIILVIFLLVTIVVSLIMVLSKNNKKEISNYTISFNTDGGTEIKSIIITEKSILEKPIDPIKEGYIFNGWYFEDKLFDFNIKIDKNYELKANWISNQTKTFNVTFNYDNGKENLILKVEENKLVTKPTTPKRNGYTFVNWYVGNSIYNYKKPITKDIVITARWKKIEHDTNTQPNTNNEENTNTIVTATSISLNKQSVIIGKGAKFKAVATVLPSNTTNKNVSWSSSNTKVATVSNGVIKGISLGTAIITAKTSNNKEATIKVTVQDKITSFSLSLTKEFLSKGQQSKLYVTKNPSDTSEKYTVTSSCNELSLIKQSYGCSVTYAKGDITNYKTCKLTVKSSSGSVSKSITIKLIPPLTVYYSGISSVKGTNCTTVTSSLDVTWSIHESVNGLTKVNEKTSKTILICGTNEVGDGYIEVTAKAEGISKTVRINYVTN